MKHQLLRFHWLLIEDTTHHIAIRSQSVGKIFTETGVLMEPFQNEFHGHCLFSRTIRFNMFICNFPQAIYLTYFLMENVIMQDI